MPYLSRTFKKNIDYVNHCIAYNYEGGVFPCKPLGKIVMLHARNMSRYQTSPPFQKAIAKQVPSYLDAVSTADRRLGDCFSEWGWCGDLIFCIVLGELEVCNVLHNPRALCLP